MAGILIGYIQSDIFCFTHAARPVGKTDHYSTYKGSLRLDAITFTSFRRIKNIAVPNVSDKNAQFQVCPS